MTSEVVQTLANSSGAALVAFISFWYLKEKDKRDQQTHREYRDAINKQTEKMQELKVANEAVFRQNWVLFKENDEYRKSKKVSQ